MAQGCWSVVSVCATSYSWTTGSHWGAMLAGVAPDRSWDTGPSYAYGSGAGREWVNQFGRGAFSGHRFRWQAGAADAGDQPSLLSLNAPCWRDRQKTETALSHRVKENLGSVLGSWKL